MRSGIGLQDLPRALRQQPALGRGERVRPTVENRVYADRIELRQDERSVGEHRRCFGRDQTIFDPWHYVPVLARKPGALRNGAPFEDWVLQGGLERVRRKLAAADAGDWQMVDILTAVLSDGLPAVETAATPAKAIEQRPVVSVVAAFGLGLVVAHLLLPRR